MIGRQLLRAAQVGATRSIRKGHGQPLTGVDKYLAHTHRDMLPFKTGGSKWVLLAKMCAFVGLGFAVPFIQLEYHMRKAFPKKEKA